MINEYTFQAGDTVRVAYATNSVAAREANSLGLGWTITHVTEDVNPLRADRRAVVLAPHGTGTGVVACGFHGVIGAMVREARCNRWGLSQEKLAAAVGISTQALRRLEGGTPGIAFDLTILVMVYLHIDLHVLLTNVRPFLQACPGRGRHE